MKSVSILGSTGSVGTQTLEVVGRFRDRLEISALAAGSNAELLLEQAKQFRPRLVSVASEADAARLREALADPAIRVANGAEGLLEVASEPSDLVIGALVGRLGLEPILAALRSGSHVALANKEVLVTAGQLVLEEARRADTAILPLDSEHVAIHQCLAGQRREDLSRVVLTASGGPFREATREQMATATPEQALAHPNWDMGAKITIDSATLLNKGFEVIEARWLFDLEPERIDVVIHPESIVHSLVEFRDGSWLAQLGIPDMRIPIAYTLGMPERLPLPDLPALDLVEISELHFEAPDLERFPALGLAREALQRGGTAPAVLNAANEVVVAAFLSGRIPFPAIATTLARVLDEEPALPGLTLDEIREADQRARARTLDTIEAHHP
ncbi:MAG: 1-deoxy-D-xylulose-5-phosphate reductoisomerase [Myxococcota bacterium]